MQLPMFSGGFLSRAWGSKLNKYNGLAVSVHVSVQVSVLASVQERSGANRSIRSRQRECYSCGYSLGCPALLWPVCLPSYAAPKGFSSTTRCPMLVGWIGFLLAGPPGACPPARSWATLPGTYFSCKLLRLRENVRKKKQTD